MHVVSLQGSKRREGACLYLLSMLMRILSSSDPKPCDMQVPFCSREIQRSEAQGHSFLSLSPPTHHVCRYLDHELDVPVSRIV